MITITISGTPHTINYTKLTVNSIQTTFEELKSPITGHRKWRGGNYLILNFLVHIFKEADTKAKYQELEGYVGSTCTLSLDNTSYITTTGDSENIVFKILSCKPTYLFGSNQIDVCTLSFLAKTKSAQEILYLIDDLDQYILTDNDEKIIISS